MHPYVKQKLRLNIRKYDPIACQKPWKEDRRGHRCIQKAPQRASKTRDATEKSRKGPQEGARDPRDAPGANQGPKVSNSLNKIDVFKKNHQIPLVKLRFCVGVVTSTQSRFVKLVPVPHKSIAFTACGSRWVPLWTLWPTCVFAYTPLETVGASPLGL